MNLEAVMALSLKVITDWRVILITIATLLVWAALRYVGSIYHKRSPPRQRSSASSSIKIPSLKRKAISRMEATAESENDLIE